MAITLNLRKETGNLVVDFDDGRESVRTAIDSLPAIKRLQADPFTHGKTLTDALGGENYLLARLQNDPDNLLLLSCDEAADSFAWEFATCSDGQFLCIKAGMLRTVERDAPPIVGDGTLNFIALAADPLVDEQGNPREGYRLDLDNELKRIRATLGRSEKSLEAKRIPPTREELYKALRKGPAILHLSCHGNVVPTENGPMAVLSLEKNDGKHDPFPGSDLMNTKRGILRMVVLSACKTATGTEANLARALALNGVPMTVGMQDSIDDRLSDEIATALYDSLFSGFTFGEALQQARQNISQHVESVGLLVGYVARNGWRETLPLRNGMPSVGNLGKPGVAMLGGEIQPPRPLLGRNLELHQLAKLYANGQKVITVAGTGGMGKTALAAAFAERFAWMWHGGVRAYSFANEVNFTGFTGALLRILFGEETAQRAAGLPEAGQREAILGAAREWDGLWLFDNYESIMQGLQDGDPEAERIHRLIGDLANGDSTLLLTSREQPAGLRNERLFPEGRHLRGLHDTAGVQLFFQHSVKAKADPGAHFEFALEIQRAAEGHPLAIALLAGEYDTSAVAQRDFLDNWGQELGTARRAGLAGHHVTFAAAFERSYARLPPELKLALANLSIFPFPFFAEGAAVINGQLPVNIEAEDESLTADDKTSSTVHRLSSARQTLHELTRRSLLEVDAWFNDQTPATWRFQPALRQEAERRAEAQKANQQKGYAAYGAWLARRGYGDIHSDLGLNRIVRLSMDALDTATEKLDGAERLWHIRRLAWLKNAWGETRAAFDLLTSAISSNLPDPKADPESARVQSSIRFELAGIYNTHGDLDRALSLYEESLQLLEQLGDKQGKAASLHQMAQVFLTRGDLDRALSLYEESLQLKEQLGDKKGKAASLSQMSDIFVQKGNLEKAEEILIESLNLGKQMGHIDGIAFRTVKLGQIAQARGDKETAIARYREGLAIFEKLKMPRESQQVRQMIASLESGGGGPQAGDPLAQAIGQARSAAERGDLQSAIQFQEQAVALARGAGDGYEQLVTLSVILYNLAGYYGNVERFDDAVKVMEEVVALDEQTGHQDLESDRQMLETFRRIAAMSPEEREQLKKRQSEERTLGPEEPDFEAQLQAQLAQLPPEQRAGAEAQIRRAFEEFQSKSPEEQAAILEAAQRARYEQAANQVHDAALAYFRRQTPKRDVLNMLEDAASKISANEAPGSPWLDVAGLCLSLIALIKDEHVPPVPARYVAHFSAVQQEINKSPQGF